MGILNLLSESQNKECVKFKKLIIINDDNFRTKIIKS
jgi:hypothetical protein